MTEFWVRADQEVPAFRGDELRRLGLSAEGRLTLPRLFKRGEDLSEVECDACGDRHIEQVHIIVEPPGSRPRRYIGCSNAGRVWVESERVEVQRIDFDALAGVISNILGLGAPRVIVEGRLWLLGNGQMGERIRDVFFARGTTWPEEAASANQARLMASHCPVVLIPNLLPNDPSWRTNGRVLLSMSDFDWFGDESCVLHRQVSAAVARNDRGSRAVDVPEFRNEGCTWKLSFDRRTIHLPHAIGLGYICELLRCPGVAIEAARLAGVSVEVSNLPALPGIALATPAAIRAVRAELDEKTNELASLGSRNWTRKAPLEEEISKLTTYLIQVETHRGEARKVAGTAQRSRTSVTNAINRSIARISTLHPKLGQHFKKSIKTGNSVVYLPVPVQNWQF